VASPVFPAWHKQEIAGEAFERSLAIVAVIAAHALAVTERGAPPALSARFDQIRACVAPIDERKPRALGPDCGRLAEAFRDEVFAGATKD
jgi:histidine ammonia-lyase